MLVEQKKLIINKSGIQKEEFIYTPKDAGNKKLSVVVSDLSEEFTTANNKKVFYINVLSNKVKVLLLAGKPSADLTFIKNALREDEISMSGVLHKLIVKKFLSLVQGK